MLYPLLRPLLFPLPPEVAHRATLEALAFAHRLQLLPRPRDPGEPVELMGLTFPNRLGLAAGLDKDGRYVDALGALGCGFIEVGTVTPRAQSGQVRPRLFRLRRAQALINRMGFPNDGAQAVRGRLSRRSFRGICGVNVGKNRDTPLERAIDDYVICVRDVAACADYVVLNVSSPNTPGLRDLQSTDHLEPIMTAVSAELERHRALSGRHVPLLVKVAPDLDRAGLHALAALIRRAPIAGVVATNTTSSRPASVGDAATEEGGLSGAPLLPLALATIRELRALLGPKVAIIGVGGIASGADALRMLEAGADLVQIYTGLVYRGPGLVAEILEALRGGQPMTGRTAEG